MDDHCIHKVHAIFRAVIEFERALEDTFNMNINELMLLCMLANTESLLAGEIACEMGLTRSNASKVIAALERKGYLKRQTCKHDSRCQRCSITETDGNRWNTSTANRSPHHPTSPPSLHRNDADNTRDNTPPTAISIPTEHKRNVCKLEKSHSHYTGKLRKTSRKVAVSAVFYPH